MSMLNFNKERIIKIAPSAGITGVLFISFSLLLVILTFNDERYTYSVFNHFISELGHTTVSPNFWLFSLAVALGGPMLSVLIMGVAYRLDNKYGYWAMKVGLVSGLACIFVGIFPADIFLTPHLIAALFFFFGTLITSALFSYSIFIDKGKNIPSWYLFPSLIVVINGIIFLGLPSDQLAEFLKDRESFNRPDIWLKPFFEWLVFFSLAIWVMLLAFFLRKTPPSP